jgi:hypothetical protein
VEKGVVTGADTGLLEPLRMATRAETATLMQRIQEVFAPAG